METSNSNHNHNEVVTTIKSEVVDGIKEKRKRKKFIRKVKCQVCEDVANDHIHYGATTCYSCRAFFRRSITAHAHYKCAKNNNCVINPQTRQRFSTFPINRFWQFKFFSTGLISCFFLYPCKKNCVLHCNLKKCFAYLFTLVSLLKNDHRKSTRDLFSLTLSL